MRAVVLLLFIFIAAGCGAKPVPLPYSQALGRYEGTDGNYTARLIISNYTTSVFDGVAMFMIPPKKTSGMIIRREDVTPLYNKDDVSPDVRRLVIEFMRDCGETPGFSYNFVLEDVQLEDPGRYAQSLRQTIYFEDVGKKEPYTARIFFGTDAQGNYGATKIELYEAHSEKLIASIELKKL